MANNQINQEIYDRIQHSAEDSGNTAMKLKALAAGISAICETQQNDYDTINWLSKMAEDMAQQIDEKNQSVVALIFQLRNTNQS